MFVVCSPHFLFLKVFSRSRPRTRTRTRGSWQGHPRYTGARTRDGRGWPANTSPRTTRLQTTAQQEQDLSRLSLRNKNSSHCHLDVIQFFDLFLMFTFFIFHFSFRYFSFVDMVTFKFLCVCFHYSNVFITFCLCFLCLFYSSQSVFHVVNAFRFFFGAAFPLLHFLAELLWVALLSRLPFVWWCCPSLRAILYEIE